MSHEVDTIFKPLGRKNVVERPGLIFGNGVEIETTVWVKASEIGLVPADANVVKIHFLPKTSKSEQTNHPNLVPKAEKAQVKIDAITGFLELAEAIKNQKVKIANHNSEHDFFLCANTNIGLALFLKQNCGFDGEWRTGQVWILSSNFTSNSNIDSMSKKLKSIE
jgi:hypothetical protein